MIEQERHWIDSVQCLSTLDTYIRAALQGVLANPNVIAAMDVVNPRPLVLDGVGEAAVRFARAALAARDQFIKGEVSGEDR